MSDENPQLLQEETQADMKGLLHASTCSATAQSMHQFPEGVQLFVVVLCESAGFSGQTLRWAVHTSVMYCCPDAA